MKKLFALLLAAVLCLSLAACGQAETSNSEAQKQEVQSTEQEDMQEDSEQSSDNVSGEIVEETQDERFVEGGNPDNITEKYVGVWYSEDLSHKLEFFEDGRMIFDDTIECQWKDYDGTKINIYCDGEYIGGGGHATDLSPSLDIAEYDYLSAHIMEPYHYLFGDYYRDKTN